MNIGNTKEKSVWGQKQIVWHAEMKKAEGIGNKTTVGGQEVRELSYRKLKEDYKAEKFRWEEISEK